MFKLVCIEVDVKNIKDVVFLFVVFEGHQDVNTEIPRPRHVCIKDRYNRRGT